MCSRTRSGALARAVLTENYSRETRTLLREHRSRKSTALASGHRFRECAARSQARRARQTITGAGHLADLQRRGWSRGPDPPARWPPARLAAAIGTSRWELCSQIRCSLRRSGALARTSLLQESTALASGHRSRECATRSRIRRARRDRQRGRLRRLHQAWLSTRDGGSRCLIHPLA